MTAVPAPLFISSRLMAAYAISGVGTLHLHAESRDAERRVVYRYVIENADGDELETGSDLRSGVDADPDYVDTMHSLLSFLTASAESAQYGSDDPSSFGPEATVWAVAHSDELSMAREMINTNPGDHAEWCVICQRGQTSPHIAEFTEANA